MNITEGSASGNSKASNLKEIMEEDPNINLTTNGDNSGSAKKTINSQTSAQIQQFNATSPRNVTKESGETSQASIGQAQGKSDSKSASKGSKDPQNKESVEKNNVQADGKETELKVNANTQMINIFKILENNEISNKPNRNLNDMFMYQYNQPPSNYLIPNYNLIANSYYPGMDISYSTLKTDAILQQAKSTLAQTEANAKKLEIEESKAHEKISAHEENDQEPGAEESDDNDPKNKLNMKKKRVRVCINVLCQTDPIDQNLWSKQKVKNHMICKSCHEAFKKNQYCNYCQQIYSDDAAANDDKEWIECDECKRWNHIDCEAEHGIPNIKDILAQDETYKYSCPNCREIKNSKPNAKRTRGGSVARGGKARYETTSRAVIPKRQENLIVPEQIIKPDQEDSNMISDLIEDYVQTKKVKLDPMPRDIPLELSPQPELSNQIPINDVAKKKLDSMFIRQQNSKKKFQTKIIIIPTENPLDIDRLMVQYGGKKLQLSENEIRTDILYIRDITKSSFPHYDEFKEDDRKGNMDFDFQMENMQSPQTDERENIKPMKSRKPRGKPSKIKTSSRNNFQGKNFEY